MNTVIFQDEITLYWEKQWELPDGVEYCAKLDGKIIKKTVKTHVSFHDLQPDTEYLIAIERLNECGDVEEVLYQGTLRTLKAKRRIDVTKSPYNAVGDGKTLNTAALQSALDDCTENDCVYLPQGTFLTGALNMHSDSELYLEQGAMLKGSEKPDDYLPKVKSRFEGTERMCYRSLINIGVLDNKAGYTTRNIAIRGGGTIFGGGVPLCNEIINAEKARLAQNPEEYIKSCEHENKVPGRARGRLISINNCENVFISGLTLGFSPSWNVHFVYSRNVLTYGCKIMSEDWESKDGTLRMERVNNGDGWDPDSSEDCTIFNTYFYTRDDAIAVKSGKNPEGNVINRPTKNIRIFDCVGYHHGIAIGSEVSGGISDVKIWDCDFFDCKTGLTVKTTAKRGGYIKDITVRNCQVASLLVRSDYNSNDDGIGAEECTKVENLLFENITVKGTYPYLDRSETYYYSIYLYGLEGEENYFNNLRFKNVQLYGREDGNIQYIKVKNVKNLSLENIHYVDNEK